MSGWNGRICHDMDGTGSRRKTLDKETWVFEFARIMHCFVGVERALMRSAFIFCLVL